MITQASLYCAAAALGAAFYLHVALRLAPSLKRKLHLPTVGWAMLPLILLMIGLLYLELVIVQSTAPGLVDEIGSATFLGLAIGRLLPVPGGRGPAFGFGRSDDDGGFDNGDGGSDGGEGGDGGSGH
jgi:uncharacterized membrane protein YgcG